jgi:hypothetical protein
MKLSVVQEWKEDQGSKEGRKVREGRSGKKVR